MLIPEAAQCLGQVVFLRMHARRPYVRHELHEAEAEAATLMGQLVWDASQRRDHDTAVGLYWEHLTPEKIAAIPVLASRAASNQN
jgi:hypothetical protein